MAARVCSFTSRHRSWLRTLRSTYSADNSIPWAAPWAWSRASAPGPKATGQLPSINAERAPRASFTDTPPAKASWVKPVSWANSGGQQGPAIHHPVKGIQHFPFRCGPQGGDLKQVVQPKGRGRCDPQGDIGFRPLHQPAIRQQIPLHPQDGLDLLAALGELVRRGHRVREGVDHPVVRDGDGPMAPTGRSGHGFLHVGEAVHGAHLGMQVQLHPLFRRCIHSLGHGKTPRCSPHGRTCAA